MEEQERQDCLSPTIKLLAVGGAGLNIAEDIAKLEADELELAVADSDLGTLKKSCVKQKIRLGKNAATKFGTGADTSLGKEIALEAADDFRSFIKDADVLFIVGGFGGGTASMSIPLISKIAVEENISLVIAFCITPLSLEGEEKQTLSLSALRYVGKRANALIELPNNIILSRSGLSVEEAFKCANKYVANAVESISQMLSKEGIINVDLPSLKRALSQRGRKTLFATASANGDDCVKEAIDTIKTSPFISNPAAAKAESLFVSLRCPRGFEMNKMQQLLEAAGAEFSTSGNVVFGAKVVPEFIDEIEICILGQLSEASDDVPLQKNVAPLKSKILENEAVKTPIAELSPTQSDTKSGANLYAQAKQDKIAKKKPARERDEIAHDDAMSQSEFTFMEKNQQRGFFENTPPNMRNGEDLDVPTFMRKNIKISL